jgi:hypothetical protein
MKNEKFIEMSKKILQRTVDNTNGSDRFVVDNNKVKYIREDIVLNAMLEATQYSFLSIPEATK